MLKSYDIKNFSIQILTFTQKFSLRENNDKLSSMEFDFKKMKMLWGIKISQTFSIKISTV